MPILKKLLIPASLFVSPDIVVSSQNYWFQNLKMLPQADLKRFLVSRIRGRFELKTLETVTNVAIQKKPEIRRDLEFVR